MKPHETGMRDMWCDLELMAQHAADLTEMVRNHVAS